MTRRVGRGFMLLLTSLFLLPVLAWSQPGNSHRGEALFVGSSAFEAGGAPCLACHGIAGHELGYAAGANYGPDLTTLFGDYGGEGVAAVLEDPSAFESMEAIYAERPLSEAEITDLTAFFESVAGNE
ncbi:MAG: c-type cytochrome, partial [Desulfuromonadales bacterium]|nr:c-type cytochrome [Desulfuromonadales bacterium]